jgi:energy-coupling factor transporter ATP-binding protein EcfA2
MTDLPTLPPGLIAVTGDEGAGKTHYLRRLGDTGALWLDLALPGQDDQTPQEIWAAMQQRSPHWDAGLHQQLVKALLLEPHQGKKLYMLSAGSRRKTALAGLLACGALVTCLDQPYAALDGASIRVVNGVLNAMADHPTRSWVVADYEAHPLLPWRQVVALDGSR